MKRRCGRSSNRFTLRKGSIYAGEAAAAALVGVRYDAGETMSRRPLRFAASRHVGEVEKSSGPLMPQATIGPRA